MLCCVVADSGVGNSLCGVRLDGGGYGCVEGGNFREGGDVVRGLLGPLCRYSRGDMVLDVLAGDGSVNEPDVREL